ncbi:MAG: hypothetical protein KatS3mg054_0589 [Chloroflexus sp.]|nr:MAG: hypothetical protein KatS3mg054_0589 [Chloroflexus sp.]
MRPIMAIWNDGFNSVGVRFADGTEEYFDEVPVGFSTTPRSDADIRLKRPEGVYGAYEYFTPEPDKAQGDLVYSAQFGALIEGDFVYDDTQPLLYVDIETTELYGEVELIAYGTGSFQEEMVSISASQDIGTELSILEQSKLNIVGYNLFNYDLKVLVDRYGSGALGVRGFSLSKFRYGGDVKDVHIPKGDREYLDLYLQLQRYDVETGGKLESFNLKSAVRQLGLLPERRHTEWTQAKGDEASYLDYATDDILDTAALAALLLPSIFAQAQVFPASLQQINYFGAGQKVDLVLIGSYALSRNAIPKNRKPRKEVKGALVEAQSGVYRGRILKADFASMYPSIIVNKSLRPASDYRAYYTRWMRMLREKRLAYKKTNPDLASAFKILINSFYGYTGSSFLFSDSTVANEITATGRELVAKLRDTLSQFGKHINTDTDGVLVQLNDDADVEQIQRLIDSEFHPYIVELETFDAALVIRMKNYILLKDDQLTIKGNSLRNRSDEPFLKEFIEQLLWHQLTEGDLTEEDLWVKITHLMGKISPENAFQRKKVGKFLKQHRAELVDGLEDGTKVDLVKTVSGWKLKEEASTEELDKPYYLMRIISAVGRFGGWMEEFSTRYNKKRSLQQKLDELGVDIQVLKQRRKKDEQPVSCTR